MTDQSPQDGAAYIEQDTSKHSKPDSSDTRHSESPPPSKRHRRSVISIPFLLGSTDIAGPSNFDNADNADNERYSEMSDGKNEARALRVIEIMNDFKTLQLHIESLVTRGEANPPDQQSYYLPGYQLLRQCNAEAQAVLATHFNPGNLGIEPGRIPDTEVQKATLQRIILDASTRRFQAHKIYLRASAGLRWVGMRNQILRANQQRSTIDNMLQRANRKLEDELAGITDDSVISDLRSADRRKNYWLVEDPNLDRMLAWIRRQT